jgi:hypothetical protein
MRAYGGRAFHDAPLLSPGARRQVVGLVLLQCSAYRRSYSTGVTDERPSFCESVRCRPDAESRMI